MSSNNPHRRVPDTVAEILKEFKSQRTVTTRPSIGIADFQYGQPGTSSDDLRPTKLSFDSPTTLNQPTQTKLLTMTRLGEKSGKRQSDSLSLLALPSIKRVAVSPSSLDWSPATKEQRTLILNAMDSRSNDLQTMVAKNEEFKKELMEIMDKEKLAMKQQKERDMLKIKYLQEQIQTAKDRAFELEQELINKKGQYRTLKISSEQDIQCLEGEKADLENKLQEALQESKDIQAELSEQLEECQGELELTSARASEQAQRLSDLEREVVRLREKDLRNEALKANLALAEQRAQNLEIELAGVRASAQQQRGLSSVQTATSRRVKELEDQLVQAREMLRGKLLLEETVATLKAQLASSGQLAEQLATQQEINKRRQEELSEWHALSCHLVSGSSVSPRAMKSCLQQLEQSHVVMKSDLNETMSQLTRARQDRSEAEAALNAERTRRQTLQNTLEAQAVNLKRMERKLQLITKERDSIQAVLVAYEGDITMVGGGQLQNLQRTRLESAESSARDLRVMLEEREKELAEARGVPGDPKGELASLQDKLQERQQEMETERAKRIAMEEHCEKLEMLLEQRALRGDYNPAETKILHFKMNPQDQVFAEKSQELAHFKQSNDRLRERVRLLEAGGASGLLNTTAVVEENIQLQSNKEITELRERLKQSEIKNQRLVECFKKTSSSFRHAIYLLFGFKTDNINDDQYRLTSLYAEREDDYLLFQIQDGDVVNIITTSFLESVPELIKTHIDEQNSIPAFLSALTLDLYSRQTFTS